jgi:two-component system chemotaxis response regulator CheB
MLESEKMHNLEVLVIDDSKIYQKILHGSIRDTGIALVKDFALTKEAGLHLINTNKYDVILIDVNIESLEASEMVKHIMDVDETLKIIFISCFENDGTDVEIATLKEGIAGHIIKPLDKGYSENQLEMTKKLKQLFIKIIDEKRMYTKSENLEVRKIRRKKATPIFKDGIDLIVIASSTGGPKALDVFFRDLDSQIGVPILIVQHMPVGFTKSLAASLSNRSKLKFVEGNDKLIIRKNQGIFAPGGKHMKVMTDKMDIQRVIIEDGELVNGVKPAADILFMSVAKEYEGANILAIVLTGMGRDGLEGIKMLKSKCNCYCVTQSKESCVVYGMPRSVDEAGLSDERIDIDELGTWLNEECNTKG